VLEESSSQDDVDTIDTKTDSQGKAYIEVSCGAVEGVLYLEKLRRCKRYG
jgi:hypothetical protein